MTLLLFVVGVGILQAFLLALFICFHPKSERSVNLHLGLYIIFTSLPLLIPILQRYLSWQFLLFVDPFLLLIGPSLYFYVRSFREKITWKKSLPHFIIFGLFIVYDSYLFQKMILQYPYSHIVPAEIPHTLSVIVRVPVRTAQMVAYYFLVRGALRTYQKSIQNLYSETSRINLSWVRWLNNGYLFLVLNGLVFYILILGFPDKFGLFIAINLALVTPYIYGATYKGMSQPTLWQLKSGQDKDIVLEEIHELEQATGLEMEKEQKEQRQLLPPEKLNEIASQIIEKMEEDKLYLQSELTLKDLADEIKIPSYQVTLAINEAMKKNFYDLVNGYRVEEAKSLLTDSKSGHIKILAIGYDSGFNSKTTFNTVFKKITGFTPTDFKERHRKALEQAL
ncbi:MAG: AraC family transcriptional regulator [Allomuricauda sp.]